MRSLLQVMSIWSRARLDIEDSGSCKIANECEVRKYYSMPKPISEGVSMSLFKDCPRVPSPTFGDAEPKQGQTVRVYESFLSVEVTLARATCSVTLFSRFNPDTPLPVEPM